MTLLAAVRAKVFIIIVGCPDDTTNEGGFVSCEWSEQNVVCVVRCGILFEKKWTAPTKPPR